MYRDGGSGRALALARFGRGWAEGCGEFAVIASSWRGGGEIGTVQSTEFQAPAPQIDPGICYQSRGANVG
jgi:hypothetical protein